MSDFHFYVDLNGLSTQGAAQAFGPDSSNPTTTFHVTSLHTASGTPTAYAVCSGQVFIQADSGDSSLVNLILKPDEQGGVGFLNVKYFIYRGITRSSLITSGGSGDQLRAATSDPEDLINAIRSSQTKRNTSRSRGGTTVNDDPSVKSLGIQYSLGGSDAKADNTPIDDLFFNSGGAFKPMTVSGGWKLGTFNGAGFGFEIMVDSLGFDPTLGDVRTGDHTITASALSSPPTLAERAAREVVLNYIDPCAYYGLHVTTGDKVWVRTSGTKASKTGEAIYTDLLSGVFATKDAVYLDIRNENGYSYDYYGNYGSEIKLAYAGGQTLSAVDYYGNGWPITILRNSDFSSGDPSNTTDRNLLRVALAKGDNTRPLLYLSKAHPADQAYPDAVKNETAFKVPTVQTGASWTDDLSFLVPNRTGGSGTEAMSYYVKVVYIRRYDSGTSAGTTRVVPKVYYLDNVFSLDKLPRLWDRDANIRYGMRSYEAFIDAEEDLGFSFMANVGVAVYKDTVTPGNPFGRIVFYATPKDTYYREIVQQQEYKMLPGLSSNGQSFFELIGKDLPALEIRKRELQLTPARNYLTFDVRNGAGGVGGRESLTCICLTYAEYTSLMTDASSLDGALHHKFLRVDQITHQGDGAGNGFARFDLKLHGIDGSTATYSALSGGTAIQTRTEDGWLLSSHDFAASEEVALQNPQNDVTWQENPEDPGRVVIRLEGTPKTQWWNLLDSSGAQQTSNGLPGGPPLSIPMGTRSVKMERKNLDTTASISKSYFRIVCWYDGELREGYVHENAVRNAKNPRLYNSMIGNYEELEIEAFVNDMEITVWGADLWDQEEHQGKTLFPRYTALVTDLKTRVSDAGGLKPRLVTAKSTGDFSDLKTRLQALKTDVSFAVWSDYPGIDPSSEDVTVKNMPVGYSTYTDNYQGPKQRIDKVASLNALMNLEPFRSFFKKKLSITIEGVPTGGSFTLTFDSTHHVVINFPDFDAKDAGDTNKLKIAIDDVASQVYAAVTDPAKFGLVTAADIVDITGYLGALPYEPQLYPALRQPVAVRAQFKAGTVLDTSKFTITSNNLTPSGQCTVTATWDQILTPVSEPWLNKICQIKNGLPPSEDVGLMAGMDGLIRRYTDTGEVFTQSLPEFFELREDLFTLRTRLAGYSGTADPEYQWLQTFTFNYDVIITLGSLVWGDYRRAGNSIALDFLKAKHAEGVPMDHSMGYIASNPIFSLLLHESDQGGGLIELQDTHSPATDSLQAWNDVKSGGKAALNTVRKKIAFFQVQFATGAFYVGHYCDLMGL